MEILLKTHKKHQSFVIEQINKKRHTYSEIRKIKRSKNKAGKYNVTIHHNKLRIFEQEEKKLKKLYQKLDRVICVSIVQTMPQDFKKNYANRDCRFIFDIDSTLTIGQPDILTKESRPLLEKLRSCGY